MMESARPSVINVEEMRTVFDGNRPRLSDTAESDQRGWDKGGNGCSEYSLP